MRSVHVIILTWYELHLFGFEEQNRFIFVGATKRDPRTQLHCSLLLNPPLCTPGLIPQMCGPPNTLSPRLAGSHVIVSLDEIPINTVTHSIQQVVSLNSDQSSQSSALLRYIFFVYERN